MSGLGSPAFCVEHVVMAYVEMRLVLCSVFVVFCCLLDRQTPLF